MHQSTIINRLLFFFLIVFLSFFSQKAVAGIISGGTIIAAPDAKNKNKITFSVTGLPPLTQSGYATPFRSYFWLFDDGHYSFEANPTHVFEGLNTGSGSHEYNITLRTTRIKSDDDIEESKMKLIIDCNGGDCDASLQNKLPHIQNDSIRIDINRSPKAGDPITYIISYENTCMEGGGGILKFNYDESYFSNYTIHSYYDEDTSASKDGFLQLDFNANPLQFGEQRNAFITLTLKPNIAINTPIVCTAQLDLNNPCEDKTGELRRGTVRSHDPNHKDVNQTLICPDSMLSRDLCTGEELGRTLTYTIRFQNIGDGPAQKVIVSDILHPYLKWNPILSSNINTSHPSAFMVSSSTLTPTSRGEIEFVFTDMDLKGTHQAGYGTDFREADTWGEITYTIEANENLPPCGSVVNQAIITFDCNAPIPTDTAATFIQNVDCCACQNLCDNFPLVQDTINSFPLPDGTVGVVLPVSEGVLCFAASTLMPEYYWYPATDLDDPTLQKPTATPDDTTTYTLTVFDPTNQLGRIISQVTVFPPNNCSLAAPNIPSPPIIATNDPTTVVLEVNNPMSACYQWYKDGILMEHRTKDSLHVAEYGSYFVEYTEEGCSVLSNTILVVEPVNIEVPPTFHFTLQPNFTQNDVELQINAPQPLKASLALFNLQGQLLTKNTLEISQSASKTLHLGAYPSGMYIVVVGDGTYSTYQKVFKY